MRRTSAVALAIGATVLGAAPLGAQARIFTEVDTTRVTVGDRITMRVSVEHAPGTRVEWPDSLDLAPFEAIEWSVEPVQEQAGTARSAAELTLTVFDLGELEIPGFDVAVVDAAGGREVLATDRYGIEVQSVGADPTGDIRDIRGPLAIPRSLMRVALWILVPLLLSALLFVVARRLRPRGEADPVIQRAALERPAHEVALEALAELEASPMLERGQVKEYHIRVSEILRAYVERRFRVPALEMTTREVLVGLENAGADRPFSEGLRPFLDQCDLVKFAKVRPEAGASRQALELGRRLVVSSVPPHVPVEGGRGEDGDGSEGSRADSSRSVPVAVVAAEGEG